MAPKQVCKQVKPTFSAVVVEEEIKGYHKDKQATVVDKICSMDVTDVDALTTIAEVLLRSAETVDMYNRKPLAVLARRLHDRLPRITTGEGSTSSVTTLATCTAQVCESAIAKVHDAIQDAAAMPDPLASLDARPNDENVVPFDTMGVSTAEYHREGDNVESANEQHERPPLLHQLHVLQTFIACLYTQDMVSEVFVHSIIDHVRYSSMSWPQVARDSAIRGICDMTLFCGKRLATIGALRSAMPDLYSHLELLTRGSSIGEATKTRINDTLSLRARGWVDTPTPDHA